jgi:hypothetical protein
MTLRRLAMTLRLLAMLRAAERASRRVGVKRSRFIMTGSRVGMTCNRVAYRQDGWLNLVCARDHYSSCDRAHNHSKRREKYRYHDG